MLARPRIGAAQREVETALSRLGTLFAAADHTPIAPPHLYLGETLLSLYGEDLRARAFLFPDAERGNELCLRPDFTVPVALVHGADGWDRPGAYAYQGPVFRRQQPGLGRLVEYAQAGVERFGDRDEATADASVLALLLQGLDALGVASREITIGDLSIPFALLDALEMPARRRAGLRRHFWRPSRFQDLLRRGVSQPPRSASRQRLLAAQASPTGERELQMMMLDAGEVLGLRGTDEVLARIARLAEAVDEAPMAAGDAALIDAMLEVRGPAPEALAAMRALISASGVDIGPALQRFEARLDALAAHGVDPATLDFDASFGRNLEYYDGFVFEVRAHGQASHPPLAGGGRYNAMTVELGAAAPVPAIGGMIRPEAVLDARGAGR